MRVCICDLIVRVECARDIIGEIILDGGKGGSVVQQFPNTVIIGRKCHARFDKCIKVAERETSERRNSRTTGLQILKSK